MKNIILFSLILLLFASCQRGCNAISRKIQIEERNYIIVMYSGGDTVFYDEFKGIINNNANSDGVYYYKDNVLVEVSGDYVIYSHR